MNNTKKRLIFYKGLKNNFKPNKECYYKGIALDPYFDHVMEDGLCFDHKCEMLAKNGVGIPEHNIPQRLKNKYIRLRIESNFSENGNINDY